MRHIPDARPPEPAAARPEDGLKEIEHLFRSGNLVGGEFVASVEGETMPVINPATGRSVAEVPRGTEADVDRAVRAARSAFVGWRRITAKERADLLFALADRIDENADLLAMLESLNVGKPLGLSREEVSMGADLLRFFAGAARSLQAPAPGEYVAGHTSMVKREPVGVVGAISPWNFPLQTALQQIAPALAAGNVCVLKPSEQTPLTALKLAELAADVLPAGVFNLVTGEGPVGAAIASHPGVDAVAITGSVAAGRAVARAAADTLKRVHLELGGNAPAVIFPDADLDAAASAIRFAGYLNSGQECGAATRVLVHRNVYDDFTRRLVDAVGSFVVGDPAEGDHVELGPLISREQLERVAGFVDRAVSGGVEVLTGGTTIERPGYFYSPSVVAGPAQDSEIVQEEVFGPVVTVQPFDDEGDAVSMANGVEQGLTASVWTSDAERAMRLPDVLDFGTVWVNNHLVVTSEMPFGGVKQSGYGRDYSTYALDDYSRMKHVMFRHG